MALVVDPGDASEAPRASGFRNLAHFAPRMLGRRSTVAILGGNGSAHRAPELSGEGLCVDVELGRNAASPAS